MTQPLDKLGPALVKMQSELDHAVRGSSNPQTGKKYADLTSCIEAARPHLVANGLAIIQFPTTAAEPNSEALGLTTMLIHSSGQFLSDTFEMKPMKTAKGGALVLKNDPQGYGSCLSYMRRYSYAAIVGLGQVDDDGNGSSGKERTNKPMFTTDQKTTILKQLEKTAPEMLDNKTKELGQPDDWPDAAWLGAQKFLKEGNK